VTEHTGLNKEVGLQCRLLDGQRKPGEARDQETFFEPSVFLKYCLGHSGYDSNHTLQLLMVLSYGPACPYLIPYTGTTAKDTWNDVTLLHRY